MLPGLNFFDRHKEYGPLFIRLIVGTFLVWGTQDNILSSAKMTEFAEFMRARGTPYPVAAAHLSVYAQFVCGILYLLGAFTRHAAVVMIVNFAAAVAIAHLGHTFAQTFPALVMLCASLFFLFHGPGRLAVDEALRRRGWRV
jgi:putative oxidoreductase